MHLDTKSSNKEGQDFSNTSEFSRRSIDFENCLKESNETFIMGAYENLICQIVYFYRFGQKS